MLRKMIIGILLVLMVALAACGGGEAETAGASDTALAQGAALSDLTLPTSLQLQVGTLLLEEASHAAVTQAQAQDLLPLWQMLRALQDSGTASQLETEAVLRQIQAIMTPEQLATIEEMNLTMADLAAMAQELGIMDESADGPAQGGIGPPSDILRQGGPPGPGDIPSLNPEEMAARQTELMNSGFGTAVVDRLIELLEDRMAPSEVVAENPAADTTEISEATPTPSPPTNTPTPTVTATPTPQSSTNAPAATATPTPTPELEGRFVFQLATGGDIYVVGADGSNLTRLKTGMDPSWSPDGSQITFVRWTDLWGIYTINADGSNERLLFSSNVARAPVWSPDGSQIAFYFETEGWTAPMEWCFPGRECMTMPPRLQTEWHLGVVDVADGYLRQPYNDRFSYSPTWSPDGEWLVYDGGDDGALPSTLHGLCVTTVEGPNNSVLTNNVHDHYPVWSPDGTRIAFMHWQHDHWEIYIMNADGSGRWPLTSSSAYVEPRPSNVAPAWSPDGEQIVFLSDRGGEWEFYVMNADGSDQRKILENVTDQLDIQYDGVYERVISWGA
jgi:cell division septation protein DedD